jgi:hypothetical protein
LEKDIEFKMKIAKCKMAKDKNLNTFFSPASLEPTGNTEKRLISISLINNSKDAFTSMFSAFSVRDNSFLARFAQAHRVHREKIITFFINQ